MQGFCSADSTFHKNSNVVNFFSALKKDDPNKQMVYYKVCEVFVPLHGEAYEYP